MAAAEVLKLLNNKQSAHVLVDVFCYKMTIKKTQDKKTRLKSPFYKNFNILCRPFVAPGSTELFPAGFYAVPWILALVRSQLESVLLMPKRVTVVFTGISRHVTEHSISSASRHEKYPRI